MSGKNIIIGNKTDEEITVNSEFYISDLRIYKKKLNTQEKQLLQVEE